MCCRLRKGMDIDMSMADRIFVNMCKEILESGTSTEGEKVRPHWEDGTPAYTIKKFGILTAAFVRLLTVILYQLRRQIDFIRGDRSKLKCF